MKAQSAADEARAEKLRARIEELDAERIALSAELHRLVDPESAKAELPAKKADPIPSADHKDWHVFAGPARHKTHKPKS
jgi:hypothetical protein